MSSAEAPGPRRAAGMLAKLPLRLETARLVLEPWTPADAPDARDAIAESVDTLRPWVPWAPATGPTLAEAEALVALWIRQRAVGENLIYAIRRRDDGTLVGATGFHDRVGPGRIEVGYWIRRSEERRGYATEAAGALVRLALGAEGFKEVVMHIHPANHGSRRVPEKLGFTVAGVRAMPAPSPAQDAEARGDLLVFVRTAADMRASSNE